MDIVDASFSTRGLLDSDAMVAVVFWRSCCCGVTFVRLGRLGLTLLDAAFSEGEVLGSDAFLAVDFWRFRDVSESMKGLERFVVTVFGVVNARLAVADASSSEGDVLDSDAFVARDFWRFRDV